MPYMVVALKTSWYQINTLLNTFKHLLVSNFKSLKEGNKPVKNLQSNKVPMVILFG